MFQRDKLRHIESFLHAARLGSFTAAAQALDLTPAAVSKNVAALEAALGVRLFNRTTRSLSLTDEGQHFQVQAQEAMDILTRAVESVGPAGAEVAGTVRMSVSNVIGRQLILPLASGLLTRHPALQLELDFDDRVVDFVQAGYDLVVRGGHIADSALIARPIGVLTMCLAASPAYLAHHGVPTTPEELPHHRLLARRFLNGRVQTWRFRSPGGAVHPFEPAPRALTVTDPEGLLAAVLDHLGIAELPVYLAWPHLQSGALKVLLPGVHHAGDYQLALQYPHRALLAPRVRTVADYLLAQLARDERLHVGTDVLAAFAA
ncbi:MAG: LysR family transcriptional regulator [Pseudomonadota bacterium]|nr:LysR family transcriptional regulator [Pseudomonadota bacterium]